MRKFFAAGGIALALLLTGCGTGGTTGSAPDDGGSGYGAPSSDATQPASDAALMTADSSLGEIVVDDEGMTLYMFDNDTQGTDTSACTGACLENWPPLISADAQPKADGITGELGTIKTADGKMQVTLNGWPLYYFAGDSAAGEVKGQGVKDIWWVLSPAGEKIGG